MLGRFCAEFLRKFAQAGPSPPQSTQQLPTPETGMSLATKKGGSLRLFYSDYFEEEI
jgi:hypothetical protein